MSLCKFDTVLSQCGRLEQVGAVKLCDYHPKAPRHAAHPIARSPFAPIDLNTIVLNAVRESARKAERQVLEFDALEEAERKAELAQQAWRSGYAAASSKADEMDQNSDV